MMLASHAATLSVLWVKCLPAYCIMLSYGGVLCGCTPPPRSISYIQRSSERWTHTCTSAPRNASPQRSRKVPSEGFIQRCAALGGNRLRCRLIYTINTKGIGFLSHVVVSLSLSLFISLCPFLCLRGAGPLSETIPRICLAPVEKLFFCELWRDGAGFKCLNRGWF